MNTFRIEHKQVGGWVNSVYLASIQAGDLEGGWVGGWMTCTCSWVDSIYLTSIQAGNMEGGWVGGWVGDMHRQVGGWVSG